MRSAIELEVAVALGRRSYIGIKAAETIAHELYHADLLNAAIETDVEWATVENGERWYWKSELVARSRGARIVQHRRVTYGGWDTEVNHAHSS